jgi:2-polyprenyl-3-methyl-5-hydroxy-6-metoxy-1,4-benzoquinol methylase
MLPRATGSELMDDPEVDRSQLEHSLRDLRAVNRWLGGTRVVVHHLRRILPRLPSGTIQLLDVATGSADIPIHLVRWARRRSVRLEILATDAHPATVALAREHTLGEPEIEVAQANALDLPYADGSFDVALCATALHHFSREDAVCVLRELGRVARCAVIVSDLRRSRLALAGAHLLAATLWRNNPVARHDGPLSVRQAFTAAELRELAQLARLANARVHTHPVFRVALVAEHAREERL